MDGTVDKFPERRVVTTQQEAVFALLHQVHYRMRDAEDAIFDRMRLEAKDHISTNLSMDLAEAKLQLAAANRAMQNIDNLSICFPHDLVELIGKKWVPVETDNKADSNDASE